MPGPPWKAAKLHQGQAGKDTGKGPGPAGPPTPASGSSSPGEGLLLNLPLPSPQCWHSAFNVLLAFSSKYKHSKEAWHIGDQLEHLHGCIYLVTFPKVSGT